MHPELMRAACEWLQRQPCQAIGTAHDGPACLRGRASRVHLHPPAAIRILRCQRQINQPFMFSRPALDNRPIGLADLPAFEQLHQLFQRLAMPPQHQTAGGVLIQPVPQCGVARQAESQVVKMRFEIIAAFWPAMHRQACGLVKHQNQPVAVEQPCLNVVFCHEPCVSCCFYLRLRHGCVNPEKRNPMSL